MDGRGHLLAIDKDFVRLQRLLHTARQQLLPARALASVSGRWGVTPMRLGIKRQSGGEGGQPAAHLLGRI